METNKFNVSRRNFLKGMAVAAGSAAMAGSLAGCASGDTAAPNAKNEPNSLWAIGEIAEPSETISADVAIVGGGGTGIAAAIQAKQLGLDAVVVDLGAKYGGSFVNTEGMSGVKSSFLEGLDPNPEVEEVVAQCMDYHHWVPSHGLYMNFFGLSGETIDWCQDLGAKFSIAAKTPTSVSYVHIYDHSEDAKGDLPGQTFITHLGEAADKLGVKSYFKTTAKKVVVEEGKVAGLLAQKEDGSILKIEAPAVILGAGGFSTSRAMFDELSDALQNEAVFSLGAEKRDGDGFRLALDAGGALAPSPGAVAWCGPVIEGCGWTTDGYAAGVQPTLWVNEEGKRFCNEDLWSKNFAAAGTAQVRQKKSFMIMSDADLKYFEESGPYVNVFTWKQVGSPMTDARKQLESLDTVYKVDSIQEAAEKLGLDADALAATLDEYNGYCKDGADPVFGKAEEHLRKLEPPFWACQISCGLYCTIGGVYVSPDMEVLTDAGEPVPGLYAGGCDAGGLFGDSYDVLLCPGTCAAFAVNTGRLAAMSAKEYLGSAK